MLRWLALFSVFITLLSEASEPDPDLLPRRGGIEVKRHVAELRSLTKRLGGIAGPQTTLPEDFATSLSLDSINFGNLVSPARIGFSLTFGFGSDTLDKLKLY